MKSRQRMHPSVGLDRGGGMGLTQNNLANTDAFCL